VKCTRFAILALLVAPLDAVQSEGTILYLVRSPDHGFALDEKIDEVPVFDRALSADENSRILGNANVSTLAQQHR
jgi:hypothetical protein